MCGGRDVYIGTWWGNLRERYHLENLGVNWSIILKCILNRMGRVVRLMWFRIETNGGLF